MDICNRLKVNRRTTRSFIIPIIDLSPHSAYSAKTLLQDLEDVAGEVICVFNGTGAFELLKSHKRIDKFCHNNVNVGVSRAWNMGINMAEGDTIFIMNSDLHVTPSAIDQMEAYLHRLENAVIVGPQGSHIDFGELKVLRYFQKNQFDLPVRTHDVSGFLFCIHRERFMSHNLQFDVRFSPCFFEEWDMGLQVMSEGLACYAVPVTGFDHQWGVSRLEKGQRLEYLGRQVDLAEVHEKNKKKFIKKWEEITRPKGKNIFGKEPNCTVSLEENSCSLEEEKGESSTLQCHEGKPGKTQTHLNESWFCQEQV